MGLFARAHPSVAGFAVVDVETTGLHPSTDRVVEIAVVQMSAAGDLTGEFCTLVDPVRDVGPTRIHGLRASDVIGAPVFADIAAAVWGLLAGRVLVAHNALFDERFLDAEFRRCGAALPPPPVMCTMALSAHYLPASPARSLTACCAAAGIETGVHHSALDDAMAAARLLGLFRSAHRAVPPSWADALAAAAAAAWVPAPAPVAFSLVTRASQVLRKAAERPPLVAFVDRLPRGADAAADAYLGVLDRVLEDRYVSDTELAALGRLAAELGLTRDAAERAHRDYLRHVCDAAWRDARVTDAERADLLEVARLVGVTASEALAILDATEQRPVSLAASYVTSGLSPRDRVVLTGEMSLPRAEIETMAAGAGLVVTSSVSARTVLVVAADPYSQSGKARQARELGVRMVTEQVFLHMLDQMTSPDRVPAASATG
ncbi:MAG: exonuclease domain-containing protein [Streptosporangiaceae bacterium]